MDVTLIFKQGELLVLLSPTQKYTVYFSRSSIYHHLDAVPGSLPASSQVFLRPTFKHTVYRIISLFLFNWDAVSLSQPTDSHCYLRPDCKYTVYLNIISLYHHLDAVSGSYPTGSQVFLRPNCKHTVYPNTSSCLFKSDADLQEPGTPEAGAASGFQVYCILLPSLYFLFTPLFPIRPFISHSLLYSLSTPL